MSATESFQYDIFLSHSNKDKPKVSRLAERLKARGLRVWYDEWVIRPGDDIYLAFERGLEKARALVICMSPNAFGSDWAWMERSTLLFRDPSNTGRRFIPLLLSDCRVPDTLCRYKFLDWRDESDSSLDELVAACKGEEHFSTVETNEELLIAAPSRTLSKHRQAVTSIAISSNGNVAISAGADKSIFKWDLESFLPTADWSKKFGNVRSLCITPDQSSVVSGGSDGEIFVWDLGTVKRFHKLSGHTADVNAVCLSPNGKIIASASDDSTIRVWNAQTGRCLHVLNGHTGWVFAVAFSPDGSSIISGGWDKTVRCWDIESGNCLFTLRGHDSPIDAVAITQNGDQIISGSRDNTIRFWKMSEGKCFRVLEGHLGPIRALTVLPDGHHFASGSEDATIRLWNVASGECLQILQSESPFRCLSFSSDGRLLLGGTTGGNIHAYRSVGLGVRRKGSRGVVRYVNAKVVLVGDTGVGKTGLSQVLTDQRFQASDSTSGRRVWNFDSRTVSIGPNVTQTQETLLWDLAGQPGYRVIHQLHLSEVAVAIVVFDARSETDPLAGVRHWVHALNLAHQRQGTSNHPMKKFLVSARNDRGGVSISEERLLAILKEFCFDDYFKTSAKEGWQIKELRTAIKQAIDWKNLPEVSSSQLFADIKSFLLEVKKSGLLLAPTNQLYNDFAQLHIKTEAKPTNLRNQFETCIGRLENRDLIRRLTFGNYVLLQPELLDAYASAMVNTAKEEPDGLGSLAEEVALAGKFFVPKEQKISDSDQEQLLLHATVEELVRYDLVLREIADDGHYLVFPSQFNRDFEDAPEPKGKAVAITFDGPVQSLYSTLVVRLGHSGLFTTGRTEMWRNAVVFTAKAGGKCGLFVNEFSEGRGRLILFFDEHASTETRFNFEEYVMTHAIRHALDKTVELVRFFVCSNGHPVPDDYVKLLIAQKKKEFKCPCGEIVSLIEPKDRKHFQSKVELIDKSADQHRDFDAFVMSAKGETKTKGFQKWAGGERVTLAIVFTDVVGWMSLAEEIRDESMNEIRRDHFAQSRRLISKFKGHEVKTIGDGFMAAFKCADAALDYARALQENTGHPQVQIRAGIHIGLMQVEQGDVFGGTVNFAARVIGAIKGAEIWLSDRAKADIDQLKAKQHKLLRWEKHENVDMKGFPGKFTLWSLKK